MLQTQKINKIFLETFLDANTFVFAKSTVSKFNVLNNLFHKNKKHKVYQSKN